MNGMGVPLIAQLCLAFGMAGLFWPEKFLAVFDVLMYPWPSGYRTVRANSIAAIILALLLFLGLWAQPDCGFGICRTCTTYCPRLKNCTARSCFSAACGVYYLP